MSPVLMTMARRLIPGISRVEATVGPFAAAWHDANALALSAAGALSAAPLWVALGDSMSQGIGARDIAGGWVGQLHARWAAEGLSVRLVNLSVTGARVADVLDQQVPQLVELGVTPSLVTVLVGANDMLLRSRRNAAGASFARLLEALAPYRTVVATLPRRNPQALAINASVDRAAVSGRIRVADMRGRTLGSLRGTRADDHFHPNERGYASIADAFAAAVDPRWLSPGGREG